MCEYLLERVFVRHEPLVSCVYVSRTRVCVRVCVRVHVMVCRKRVLMSLAHVSLECVLCHVSECVCVKMCVQNVCVCVCELCVCDVNVCVQYYVSVCVCVY